MLPEEWPSTDCEWIGPSATTLLIFTFGCPALPGVYSLRSQGKSTAGFHVGTANVWALIYLEYTVSRGRDTSIRHGPSENILPNCNSGWGCRWSGIAGSCRSGAADPRPRNDCVIDPDVLGRRNRPATPAPFWRVEKISPGRVDISYHYVGVGHTLHIIDPNLDNPVARSNCVQFDAYLKPVPSSRGKGWDCAIAVS